MLSPVLDFSIQRFWTCSFEWLFLNVLVPCGGKRYVQGNMLSDLLVFSQGGAKIRSDTHFHTLAVIQQQPLRTRVVCCDPEDWQLGCIRNVFMVSAASWWDL